MNGFRVRIGNISAALSLYQRRKNLSVIMKTKSLITACCSIAFRVPSKTTTLGRKWTQLFARSVAYPGILLGGGGSTNSVEDRGQREQGSGGGSPLLRGSGGSCNLVQEISFHIVKFSSFFGTLKL